MRKPARLTLALSFAILLTGSLMLVSTKSRADGEDSSNKRLLVTCTVQEGDNVVKIGDTCGSGGNGCSPNPCQ